MAQFKNPAKVGRLKLQTPVPIKKNKGNLPWLQARRRLRKSMLK